MANSQEFGDPYCDSRCVQILLMLFNVVFWIAGAIIAYSGLVLKLTFEPFMKISHDYVPQSPYILFGFGICIIVVATLACTCTLKGNNSALLNLYGLFLVTSVIILITLSAFFHSYEEKLLYNGLDQGIRTSIRTYGWKPNQNYTIDFVQTELHCCGSKNYTDWLKLNPLKKYPRSCLPMQSNTPFAKGCYYALQEYQETAMPYYAGAISITALLALFGAILACCLANGRDASYEPL